MEALEERIEMTSLVSDFAVFSSFAVCEYHCLEVDTSGNFVTELLMSNFKVHQEILANKSFIVFWPAELFPL